jgi:hypothetical protein
MREPGPAGDVCYVDRLREKIRTLEKSLREYGFNDRRGIETWKIGELKDMFRKMRNQERVREILKELVEIQETLYLELYRLSGAKEIIVDTDTPEKRLKEIKAWLQGQKNNRKPKGLFAEAVRTVLENIEKNKDPTLIIEILTHIYQRDYDRFRVLDFLLSLCKELDSKIEESGKQDLNSIAKIVVFNVSKVGVNKVRKLAKARLGTWKN